MWGVATRCRRPFGSPSRTQTRCLKSLPLVSPKALSSRTFVKSPNKAGAPRGVGGRGRGAAEGPRRAAPPDPGRPLRLAPRRGRAHAHAHLRPECGKMAFLPPHKGSLLRSHKSRRDPLFQRALRAHRRRSPRLQRALEARRGGGGGRGKQQASRRASRALSAPRSRPGSRGAGRGEPGAGRGRQEAGVHHRGPKGVLNSHVLVGLLPFTRV